MNQELIDGIELWLKDRPEQGRSSFLVAAICEKLDREKIKYDRRAAVKQHYARRKESLIQTERQRSREQAKIEARKWASSNKAAASWGQAIDALASDAGIQSAGEESIPGPPHPPHEDASRTRSARRTDRGTPS